MIIVEDCQERISSQAVFEEAVILKNSGKVRYDGSVNRRTRILAQKREGWRLTSEMMRPGGRAGRKELLPHC